jgi:hypothetical protein
MKSSQSNRKVMHVRLVDDNSMQSKMALRLHTPLFN